MSIRRNVLDFLTNNSTESFTSKLRRKRFKYFIDIVNACDNKNKINVIDIGGTSLYWKQVYNIEANPYNLSISLFNINCEKDIHPIFNIIVGDARNLSAFKTNNFDICFSNSFIEHIGDFTQQFTAINEMKRISKYIYFQTPNFYFPFEPHYQLPFVHWLPFPVKMKVLDLMGTTACSVKNCSLQDYLLDPINLLSLNELKFLFDSDHFEIITERLFFLKKSFVVRTRLN